MALAVGDKAPHFQLMSTKAEMFNLEAFKGSKVALYFVASCTRGMCGIFNHAPTAFNPLAGRALVILPLTSMFQAGTVFAEAGVWPLPFLLDVGAKVFGAYGLGEQSFGTYVVNEQGVVQHVLDPSLGPSKVLEFVTSSP